MPSTQPAAGWIPTLVPAAPTAGIAATANHAAINIHAANIDAIALGGDSGARPRATTGANAGATS
jgi:hypothetical protein